ncbi:MAG: DNA/RNA non-specific endonuclease [Clostridia bacterium]|nr:DNA/RNA non-specific endonuclease [Clostridia bacterium]
MRNKFKILSLLLALVIFLSGCGVWFTNDVSGQNALIIGVTDTWVDSLEDVPEFSDEPFVIINNNKPYFTESEITTEAYEYYSPLDSLGRCGYAKACIGTEIMPTEEREEIGMIKPTGWHTVKYDNVDGKYLYNRCHLIGFQLAGENANEKNLITGTRYLNVDGMLPFENLIADYVKETGNHVMYRVTPIFEGKNLLASGVLMEGYSVEDGGEAICFNFYAYNAQPGIIIDYATGKSKSENEEQTNNDSPTKETTYIINKNTKKFHLPDCASIKDTKPKNKEETSKSKEELEKLGYSPCKSCIGE